MPHAAKIFTELMWLRHALSTDMTEENVDHEIKVKLDKLRADNWNLGPKVRGLAYCHGALAFNHIAQKRVVKVTLLCEEERLLFDAYEDHVAHEFDPSSVNHDADYSAGKVDDRTME